MPNERKTDQRIRPGLHPVSDVTSSFAVSGFAVQSDQDDADWWVLDGWRSTPPRPARRVKLTDGSAAKDGFYSFDWVISYMTFGMLAYWLDLLLPDGVEAAEVTAMTYDENDVAVYLQAIINKPSLPGDGEPTFGGWKNVRWAFDSGVIITA